MTFLISQKKLFYWVVACFVLSLVCCKKSEQPISELSKLPAITQTGANTFGYLLNGVAVSNNNIYCSYIVTAQTATVSQNASFKLIGVDSTSAGKQTLTLNLVGIDPITDNSNWGLEYPSNVLPWYGEYNITDNVTVTDYRTAFPPAYGTIGFSKIDTVNKTLSGTFSFVGANSTNPNVTVTQGRFDVHYVSK